MRKLVSVLNEHRLFRPIAYVLITAEPKRLKEVVSEIRKIEGVVEAQTSAYTLYGNYNILAKIQAETMDQLEKIVASRIRRLESVRSTATMIVTENHDSPVVSKINKTY